MARPRDSATDKEAGIQSQFLKTALSIQDLEEAGLSLGRIRELDEFDFSLVGHTHDFLAHTVCLVVSYGRIFAESKGNEVASRPKGILKGLSDRERKMHQRLLRLRGEEFAHSDARPAGFNLPVGDINGVRLPIPISRVMRRHSFARPDLAALESLFQKVGAALSSRFQELSAKLPVN